ncbi:VOC family protein [Anaerofustis stercorihominis]|uniref:VOC family protein n=1 Tax=Anaerofustis stercorihominis TaxID=214853 RepID=UPI00214ABA57|nr:VOC family protein [Anaerofustis stercorihominis]MCR2032823.1 VOC family protein [Anaerofustis stercorihominis]
MKLKNPMLVVEDMERSKKFYKEVLGLRVLLDFGANITLTGGLCLQTKDSYEEFIEVSKDDIKLGGNDFEIYFEENKAGEFDKFIEKLNSMNDIKYVHKVKEHSWGQRVVRIYDPDNHIIEIGEDMKNVCKRFADSGMNNEEIAVRMDVPVKFVNSLLK